MYGVFARVIVRAKKNNLLSRGVLEEVEKLHNLIAATTAKDTDGSTITVNNME